MENEITKTANLLFAPSWKFWINKKKLLSKLSTEYRSRARFCIPDIVKFIDANISNASLVDFSLHAMSLICSPLWELTLEFEESAKKIGFHEREKLKFLKSDFITRIDKLYHNLEISDSNIEKGVDKIAEFLSPKNEELESGALQYIGALGPFAKKYINKIEKYLDHDKLFYQLQAKYDLENVTGKSYNFFDAFFKYLSDSRIDYKIKFHPFNSKYVIADQLLNFYGTSLRKQLIAVIDILDKPVDDYIKEKLIKAIAYELIEENLNDEEIRLLDILYRLKDNPTCSESVVLPVLLLNPNTTIPYLIKNLNRNMYVKDYQEGNNAGWIIAALTEIKVNANEAIPTIEKIIKRFERDLEETKESITESDIIFISEMTGRLESLKEFHSNKNNKE